MPISSPARTSRRVSTRSSSLGVGSPGWMIVKQHDRRGAAARRRAKHLPRMDDARVERADREDGDTQHAVLRVEQDHAELLDGAAAELREKKLGGILGDNDLRAFVRPPHERATACFDGGDQLRSPRGANAGQAAQLVHRRSRESVETADRNQHRVGKFERAGPRGAVAKHDGEQFVVAKHRRYRGARAFHAVDLAREPSSWPLSAAAILHTMRRLPAIGLLLLLAAGCSEPPQKEINQAQGAIDAARAAGADKYAAEEYNAATTALQKSHDAVDQRDYRQALSYALDARERAQDAARQAADGKARARITAEVAFNQISARAQQLEARIKTAEAARVPARELQKSRDTLAKARTALQEARTTIDAGNYSDVASKVSSIRSELDAALTEVEGIPQRPARKRK